MKPQDLNIGDTFYECSSGWNYEMIVETKPELFDDQWKWTAKDRKGNIQDYIITKGFEHYGPKIYTCPQYAKFYNGKADFESVTL